MRAVLLTEWRGPLAHAVAGGLLDAGALPVVLAEDATAASAALPAGAVVRRARTFAELRLLMVGVDAVVDLRRLPRSGRGVSALRLDYRRGTHDLVTAAFDARVPRLVWVRPLSALDGPHWATYRHTQEVVMTAALFGLPVSLVEVPELFGPEPVASTLVNSFIARVATGRVACPWLGALDLLFAGTAAGAVVEAAGGQGPVTRTLTGLRRTCADIATLIAADAGRAVLPRLLAAVPALLANRSAGAPLGAWDLSNQVLRADVGVTAAHFRCLRRTR